MFFHLGTEQASSSQIKYLREILKKTAFTHFHLHQETFITLSFALEENVIRNERMVNIRCCCKTRSIDENIMYLSNLKLISKTTYCNYRSFMVQVYLQSCKSFLSCLGPFICISPEKIILPLSLLPSEIPGEFNESKMGMINKEKKDSILFYSVLFHSVPFHSPVTNTGIHSQSIVKEPGWQIQG